MDVVVVLVVVVLLVTQQVAPVVNASAACTVAADAADVAIAVHIACGRGSTHTSSTGADVTSGLQRSKKGISTFSAFISSRLRVLPPC